MAIHKTPATIKHHRYNWLFEAEWQMIHNRMDGNSFAFFIGGNGTGKTYAALSRAEILGVDEHEKPDFLFNPDELENHVFFDKVELYDKITELEKLPANKIKGYQLILDEAQKTVYGKDWMSTDVKDFNKEMTTIRSSRFSIALTMPTIKMITTDLRCLGTYQCEMKRIDLRQKCSYSSMHLLELKAFFGDVWRRRPYVQKAVMNPITGLPGREIGLLHEFRWDLPSRSIRRGYEKLKKEFRTKSSEERSDKMAEDAKQIEIKKNKLSYNDAMVMVETHPSKYRDLKGKFDWGRIYEDKLVGMEASKRIAKRLNEEDVQDG